MKSLSFAWLSLASVAGLSGCGDVGTGNGPGPDMTASAADLPGSPPVDLTVAGDLTMPGTRYGAALGGGQEVPPSGSSARGSGTVTIDAARSRIDVTLDVGGLGSIVAAHIHAGKAGTNGPVIFPLAAGAFTSPLSKSLTATDLMPSAAAGINSFADAVSAIASGAAYLNVHTSGSPAGEVRGQIGAATLKVVLSNSQEWPAAATAATGSATVKLNAAQDAFDVTLDAGALPNITAAHIHFGGPGENGKVIFPLAAGAFTSPLTKTLKAADLAPDADDGIASFADAINALLSGATYVNVHTNESPGGAIRGQVGKASLRASGSPGQESGNIVSTGSGSGRVDIDAEHSQLAATFSFQNLSGPIVAAHLHGGRAGTNGPVVFPLAGGGAASPLSKTLFAADLMPGGGITTFDDAIDFALAGRLYFNVHTAANPGGEVRAQVGPALLKATLAGANEVPNPVQTSAAGSAVVAINGAQSGISVTLTTANLMNPTAAHIHAGLAGANGPVIFPLAGGGFGPSVVKALAAADLMPSMPSGINTMADAVAALLGQRTYVNVHTAVNPGGELRGQVIP